MSESYTQLPPDGSGKKARTLVQTIGANEVHQSVVAVGAGDSEGVAPCTAADGLSVKVTNLPVEQPVSGPLTDGQLRATAVPVSGTFYPATQPVSGPLTDDQLRAAAVPVSAASLPLPSGAATEATIAALLGDKPKLVVCVDWASATVFYKGWAAPGSAVSAAAWAICKRVFDANGGFVETWADGNTAQDNVWNDRATLTYS